jgi:hypothetical protein
MSHSTHPFFLSATFLAALAGLAGAGCPGLTEPLRDCSLLNASETVALFVREEAAVSTLQGEVKARIESPKQSGTLQAVIVVKRPHSFRMRAYPRIMGGTVFDLAIRKDRIEFFLPSEETLYVQKLGGSPKAKGGGGEDGKDGAEKKGPDLDTIFGSTSLARMILGTTIEENGEVRFMDRDDDGVRLAVVNSDAVVEGYVWLDPVTHFKTRQVVFGEGGKIVLSLAFDEYEEHEPSGLFWPGVIEIRAPKEEFRLEMTFDVGDLDLNGPLEEELFDVEIPEGTKRVERE